MRCSICDADDFDSLAAVNAHRRAAHPGEPGRSASARRGRRSRNGHDAGADVADVLGSPDVGALPPDVEPRPKRAPRTGALERRLLDQFTKLAVLPALLGDEYCAGIALNNAPKLAAAWAAAAAEHKWLRDALDRGLKGGTLFGAVATTALTVYPILAHHGYAPRLAVPLGEPDAGAGAPTTREATRRGGAGIVE